MTTDTEAASTMLLQMNASADRIPRHEHRVRAYSRNYDLITQLGDRYTAESDEAAALIAAVSGHFGVAEPDLAFNRRRRPDTGQCWAPRPIASRLYGEDRIVAWEAHHRRAYPSDGQIRLGATTTLRTIGHELGHHLVHVLEPLRTPSHGRVWVGRFDDAMEVIARQVRLPRTG
jgi:hypothetical protein